jgi:hypothetical protein
MDVIMGFLFSSPAAVDALRAEQAVHRMSVAGNAEFYWPASWPDWAPWKRAKRESKQVLDRLITRQIDHRLAMARAAWPDDVLSRLLALHADDGATWPREAVRDECMTAFLAGHETTAATLTWWAWCMANNPAAQAAARSEVETVLQGRTPARVPGPASGDDRHDGDCSAAAAAFRTGRARWDADTHARTKHHAAPQASAAPPTQGQFRHSDTSSTVNGWVRVRMSELTPK